MGLEPFCLENSRQHKGIKQIWIKYEELKYAFYS